MTTKQELERRILSKVTPISREPTEPTQLPQLPHNHQKGVQCRSCRTLRRIAKNNKEQAIASRGLAIFENVSKELLRDGTQLAGTIFTAHGEGIRGWLSDSDPVTWLGGGVFVSAYVLWIASLLAKIPNGSGGTLADTFNIQGLLGNIPTQLGNVLDKTLGRDDTGGTWGIRVTDIQGNPVNDKAVRWYDTQAARDAGFILLQTPGLGIGFGDFSTGGTGYQKVRRRFTPGGGFVTSSDSQFNAPPPPVPPGFWSLTETFLDGSTHIAQLGTDQASAEASYQYALKSVGKIYQSVTLNAPS